jgi:uncharacterized membrane protein
VDRFDTPEVSTMSSKPAITVLLARDQVERLWRDPSFPHPHVDEAGGQVSFLDAPGDRGTEIHVELGPAAPAGILGEAVMKLTGKDPVAKVKDDLRRFKQRAETGVISVSEAVPEGESLERKFKQRPAQPLSEPELPKVGA